MLEIIEVACFGSTPTSAFPRIWTPNASLNELILTKGVFPGRVQTQSIGEMLYGSRTYQPSDTI